jgi:hypothetical protein
MSESEQVVSDEIEAPKRYLLFGGDIYYPTGGWDDFAGDFDTADAATAEGYRRKFDWFHVIDRETLNRVVS